MSFFLFFADFVDLIYSFIENLLSISYSVSSNSNVPNSGSVGSVTRPLENNSVIEYLNTLHNLTDSLIIISICILVLLLVLFYLLFVKNFLLNSKFNEYFISIINNNSRLKDSTKDKIIKRFNNYLDKIKKTNNYFIFFLILFIIFGEFLIIHVLVHFSYITNFKFK